MTRFLFEAYPRGADANNAPMSGAKMYVYEAGTTTPVTVYSDIANTIPHAHPIVADASGVWPQIYLPNGTYKVVIASAADVVIQTIDNVYQIDDAGETVVDDTAALIADTSLYYGAGLGGVAEGDYVRTRTGRLFIVADENATDAHAETAGGVKLYETGFSYSSFSNFEAAIDRGDFSGVWNGSPVEVAGTTYVKDDRQTFIPGLPGWRYPWQVRKELLSSDWQPRSEAPMVARMRSVMDSIAEMHPDLTHAHILGDLVDDGEVGPGDTPTLWGFPEFLADWTARIPVPVENAFFMPGNHDVDKGRSFADWIGAFSMRGWRKWIGPEYFATKCGNLIDVYLGQMGGSGGGCISDNTVEWFSDFVDRNEDANIRLNIHQPLSGCYNGFVESDPGPGETVNLSGVQAGSARITDILDRVAAAANNIVCVFHGHSGSALQFNDETHHGTRHLQIGMHLPSNVDNERNDQFYTMDMQHGASSFDITQWDATAQTELTTKTITLRYPLQLAPTVERMYDSEDRPGVYPLHVNTPLDIWRKEVSPGVWGISESIDDVIPLAKLGASDRSNDGNASMPAIGIRIDYPSATGNTPSFADVAAHGSLIGAAWDIWQRTGGTVDDPEITKFTRVWSGSDIVTAYAANKDGVQMGDTIGTTNPATSQVDGVSLRKAGYISAYRSEGIPCYLGRGDDGAVSTFYRGASSVGTISVTGSATAYNTSSDARLKTDLQDFDGLATIRALAVYDYAWRADGSRAKGVMAQEAHEVAPYAVSVGGDDPAKEPWGVDYSKLVPDLIRAVQQLEERIKELEG